MPINIYDGKLGNMDGERIEAAVKRIELALGRIAKVADQGPQVSGAPAAVPANVSQLVVQHEELRETVAAELRKLDDVIGKLEG
ncbi:hypothetical protein OAS19_01315 [Altererythrobacter sp.]|nr:hypothetical protein [Altererythrobacter sp.]